MFIFGKVRSAIFQKFIDNKLKYFLGAALILGLLNTYKSQFIVATVNGQPISRWALIKELESQGKNLAIDSLISQNLIMQEAKKKNISVSKKDIDKEVENIRKSFESSGQTLDDVLGQQNLSKKVFLKQVKLQLIMDKLLSGNTKVTQDEINQYIEENRSFYPEGTSDDDLRKSAEDQLKQKQLNTKVQNLLNELKSKASINYFDN